MREAKLSLARIQKKIMVLPPPPLPNAAAHAALTNPGAMTLAPQVTVTVVFVTFAIRAAFDVLSALADAAPFDPQCSHGDGCDLCQPLLHVISKLLISRPEIQFTILFIRCLLAPNPTSNPTSNPTHEPQTSLNPLHQRAHLPHHRHVGNGALLPPPPPPPPPIALPLVPFSEQQLFRVQFFNLSACGCCRPPTAADITSHAVACPSTCHTSQRVGFARRP